MGLVSFISTESGDGLIVSFAVMVRLMRRIVMAGLVPAISMRMAQCLAHRDRRDEPGDGGKYSNNKIRAPQACGARTRAASTSARLTSTMCCSLAGRTSAATSSPSRRSA